ncbi:hypothetical protein AURDEDRAFT_118233 [Auricularia subglabra TFB-10046 SS5]|uniref:Uncharacterized protein n=1 Tax=Auricularia subglabra (strain TFB-10046 / SS5) TaxID=717982 RepID=J0L7C4_AURST|nr:hypothetical protein AURDEDRAFT_118233 [Auricularia subglabra TFB-10046 SS5]
MLVGNAVPHGGLLSSSNAAGRSVRSSLEPGLPRDLVHLARVCTLRTAPPALAVQSPSVYAP